MVGVLHRRRLLVLAAVVLMLFGHAHAEVVASVDRASVELNESFTLKLSVDSEVSAVPDVSHLEADFLVGQPSQLSNTTIVNGRISRSRTWTYVMMAKRAGDLTIPPISVGSESSNAVRIKVAPQSNALPGEAEIFVTSDVDHEESFVQAQVLLSVKLYRSVATRQPRLSEPSISGVEVLIESASEERSYESILNGTAYHVIERVYALFPQESGTFDVAPIQFDARVLRNGRITGRKVFQSEPIAVTVKPIPPPPSEFPGAAWFPAKSVELREDWSREPDDLPAGEPITRHVTVTALGQLATQIPVMELEPPAGLRIYPDKPELRTVADPAGIRASRKDQYAMIGIEAGELELPQLELPWWNIDAGRWETARLPAASINIVGGGLTVPITDNVVDEPAVAPAEPVIVHSALWQRISEVLAALWVLTLVAWWWSRRPNREPREAEEPPLHKRQARLLKNARKAALAADDAGVKSALLDWGRLQWPDDAPRSVGELATRVSDPLSGQLAALCRASYGPAGNDWDGQALAKSLRSFSIVAGERDAAAADDLPPLFPGAA
ncbi:MAG: BatD family protein [Gammaproteobacteria bacterium]|nr:BatD family protein [Gammaproteobacteria bacterium]